MLAHGCEEHPVTDRMEISTITKYCAVVKFYCYIACIGTHDIQRISIASPLPNIIRIAGEFIRGSSSIGVVVVTFPLDLQLGLSYRFIPRESTTSLRVENIRVPGGDYSISVFVVEESGLPFTRTASTPINVTVGSG